MTSAPLPRSLAWRHVGAREGFEVAFLSDLDGHLTARGSTAAVEAGRAWACRYTIELDAGWRTVSAAVDILDPAGPRRRSLRVVDGRWTLDGSAVPELDGCLDVDLEASALTNAFPVRRSALGVAAAASAPAAFVTASGAVRRLEQHYRRRPDAGDQQRYDYRAPAFDFTAVLTYAPDGFVLDYPGLAQRLDS